MIYVYTNIGYNKDQSYYDNDVEVGVDDGGGGYDDDDGGGTDIDADDDIDNEEPRQNNDDDRMVQTNEHWRTTTKV